METRQRTTALSLESATATISPKSRMARVWEHLYRHFLNIRGNTDEIFYRIGLSIGTKPWYWLLLSVCINCICAPGISLWKEDVDDIELYMPKGSKVYSDSIWVRNNFRDDLRYESIIVTAPNVLEPEVLRVMSDMEKTIKGTTANNNSWKDVCAGYLTWFENENSVNPMDEVDDSLSSLIDQLNHTMFQDGCIYQSLLKLWPNIKEIGIGNLTIEAVLNDITGSLQERKGNILLDIGPLLSGIEYDATGRVKSAKATIMNWILKKSNPNSPDWETKFVDRILHLNGTLPAGMEIYVIAFRSFNDFLKQVLNSNMAMLCCGILLIVFYVMVMIGRCNAVEVRVYLALIGVSVVGLAILSSYGVCFYFGYSYGPVHPILPFLMLGIGVDDMFVIMQSLENLSDGDKVLPLPQRIGKAVQHSGMSITVTSFTNVVAFGIGVMTQMPFLRSFCVFATIGIVFLYVYQITFFVGCLVIDEKRLESKKDGICCRKKTEWRSNDCSQGNWQRFVFENYIGPFIARRSIKIIILLITGGLICMNIWALCQLEQNFDPLWYLDQDSYPVHFNNKLKEYFPKYGKHAGIYIAGADYYEDRDVLFHLVDELKRNPYVNGHTVNPWFIAYEKWLNTTNKASDVTSSDEYYGYLSEYILLTKEGQAYIKDIKFDKLPTTDYNITASKIQIQHVFINTTTDQIRAMKSIRDIVASTNLSERLEHIAVFSPDYVSWAANDIIGDELLRNLTVEILAVGAVTLILLRNFRTSFWVICCVLFTLIDLLGFMYFIGLTVEISTSVIILICAGLSVDFAAHIGLEYTRAVGTENERMISTLRVIGPAVFNGGFSTFLAFVLLSTSKAYIFSTFFKLFTCVVVFGLFHGLFFLPVILSLVGPNAAPKNDLKKEHVVREQNGYYTVRLSEQKKGAEGAVSS